MSKPKKEVNKWEKRIEMTFAVFLHLIMGEPNPAVRFIIFMLIITFLIGFVIN